MMNLSTLQKSYEAIKQQTLKLNMQRGQPSDADFDLSNPMLQILDPDESLSPSGIELRNYGGGPAGLPEARELFAEVLDLSPNEIIVWNNASLELQSHVLMWAMLKGLQHSETPWVQTKPKMIVTVPGYDRHFLLLQSIGFELITVAMMPDGPDLEAIETLVKTDAHIKGLLFVPTYSNPTGDSISQEKAKRLASMATAAKDFTLFIDDAYRIHHLYDEHDTPVNFIKLCQEAGKPDRAYVFSSTSKVTFGGGGLGYAGSSASNITYLSKLLNTQSIGPNKLEQYRHVKFLRNYPGGITGLMKDHADIIRPKFEAVYEVLEKELADSGLASWTEPKGGYFISLNTTKPVAKRVIELANNAGVSLTPAGATYPNNQDPKNSNIRLAPTRPPVEEVRKAMEVVALCIKLASAEWEANT